jgi:hypothetical protein
MPRPTSKRYGHGRSPRLDALKTMLEMVEVLRTERRWLSTGILGRRFGLSSRQTLRYMRCIEAALPVAVEKQKRHQGDCLWPCYWRWIGVNR